MLLIGWGNLLSRHNQSEALPRSGRVTRHQYRISAVIFQTSFLVTRRNSILRCTCYACELNKSTELIFVEHEKEKKRRYQQRVIDVEMGSFTPLNFGTHELFLSNLADKPFRKNGESYASAISWLRTRKSFEILRSVHTCVRGSRTPFHKNADFSDDFSVIKCKQCGHF